MLIQFSKIIYWSTGGHHTKTEVPFPGVVQTCRKELQTTQIKPWRREQTEMETDHRCPKFSLSALFAHKWLIHSCNIYIWSHQNLFGNVFPADLGYERHNTHRSILLRFWLYLLTWAAYSEHLKLHPTDIKVDEYIDSKHQGSQNSFNVKASFSLRSRWVKAVPVQHSFPPDTILCWLRLHPARNPKICKTFSVSH